MVFRRSREPSYLCMFHSSRRLSSALGSVQTDLERRQDKKGDCRGCRSFCRSHQGVWPGFCNQTRRRSRSGGKKSIEQTSSKSRRARPGEKICAWLLQDRSGIRHHFSCGERIQQLLQKEADHHRLQGYTERG